jgi:L-iditol 2-dehydrogenase
LIKAGFVGTKGHVELREVPRPELEQGSIMVRMKSSGICGTDLEKLSGAYTSNMILGHEVSGEVVKSKTELYSEGERVIPHHHVACGKCALCVAGAETMCEQFKRSNFDPGGFAEEFRVAKYNVDGKGVHKFDRISFDSASFVEPLGCCIRGLGKALPGHFGSAVDRRQLKVKNVLVVGAGPIGLLHMELLRSEFPDLNLVAVDISRIRLDFAQKYESAIPLNSGEIPGGNFSESARQMTGDLGFDLAIVATGNPVVFPESVRSTRKSGRLLLFGAMHKGSNYTLDLQSMLLNELTITTSYATTESEMDLALNLLEEKRVNVEKFVTAKLPLEKVDEAMQTALSENQVKVIVNHD